MSSKKRKKSPKKNTESNPISEKTEIKQKEAAAKTDESDFAAKEDEIVFAGSSKDDNIKTKSNDKNRDKESDEDVKIFNPKTKTNDKEDDEKEEFKGASKKGKKTVNQEKPKHEEEELKESNEKDQPQYAAEDEPDTEPAKNGIKSFFKKLAAIITAPEDNDLAYGSDEELEDIFFEEESEENENDKQENTSSGGKKNDLPKSLTTSSMYMQKEKKTAVRKKESPAKDQQQSSSKKKVVPAQDQQSAEKEKTDIKQTSQTELKEHVPVAEREETEKKENIPVPKNQKKPKNKKSGQSEITIDEIIKAKNSVPERSAKAYGALDTADKEERENETEIPIFVNHGGQKKSNGRPGKKTASNTDHGKDFDLGALSADSDIKEENPSVQKKTQKPDELSHDKPDNSDTQPKVQKPGELSHDVPEKQTSQPKAQKPGELSHDVPIKPVAVSKHKKPDELSRFVPEKKNSGETADSLPGGQGVKIEPWSPKQKQESVKKETKTTSRSEGVVYRGNEASPFIVMAGKFTRTLKSEYDSTRRLRGSIEPPPKTPEQSESEKKDDEPESQSSAGQNEPKMIRKKSRSGKKETAKKDVKKEKIKAEKAEKKSKFKISDIFTYEGDSFDEEEEEEPEKPELTDYSSEDDAEEIKGDINENFRKVFVRTIVLTCTCVASVTAAIIAKWMPWVFLNMMKSGWLIYSGIMFVLFVVSIFVSRYPIANGFMPLRKLRGNSDTPVSVASLAVAVQSIISLFMPNVFLDETYHIYVPLLILSLLLNSLGKLLIIRRTADNFRFLCSKEARFAGKIYTKTENADRIVSGLPSRKPIIAYCKRSKFMSNFLQLSYAADPVEELSAFFAPIAAGVSVLCAIIYGIMTKDFASGVCSFALSACITIPMCSLLAINIPMLNLCSSANKSGAMVVGYEAVKQFCDTNTIMLDSSDLYPKGSIILSGMKTINESKLQEAISAGAAMTFAVNGPLTHVFETIVRQSKYKLPDFDSVSYDDEMGLSGWSNGNRILIGRRELFEKHNIRLPDESVETKYRKRGNEIAYISVGGELAVMFILTYKADRAIAQSLRNLEDSGVSFVIRTIDPNITQQHVAEKFSLYPRCIKILPTGLGMICHDELSAKEKTSRAYLVTNGKLSSFANAVAGCIRIKSTVTIAKIVQYLAIIIGFILVTVISFISGFAKLGSFELLIYTGFWCAALIAVSIGARKLS